MAFVKGKSGNPGGKPKELKNVLAQARRISPVALRVLKKILNDKSAGNQVKVSAASVVLDRAWGKPAQAITGADGGPAVMKFTWEGQAPPAIVTPQVSTSADNAKSSVDDKPLA